MRLLLLLAAALPALAQSVPVSVLPDDALAALATFGSVPSAREIVPVDGQPFDRALRVETRQGPPDDRPEREYALRIRANLSAPVAAGDSLVASFWLRCAASATGRCLARLILERNSDPWTKSANRSLVVGPEWRRVQVPIRMAEAYPPAAAGFQFWLGYEPQALEIAGVSLVNHGHVAFTGLGLPLYEGREWDAPWRAEAAERIDRIRKSPLTVEVRNAAGLPIPNAAVSVRMKRHAFGFGTAVAAAGLLGTGVNDLAYQRTFLSLFNRAVMENDLKWPNWESNRQRALDGVRWLRERGIPVRGHNLVWPGWRYLPTDVQPLQGNPAALRTRVNAHIESVATTMRGQLIDWDVLNEPYNNRDLQGILGNAAMAEWFALARRHDPDAKLYLNDFDLIEKAGDEQRHRDYTLSVVHYIEHLGAPVDGIGLQGHFNETPTAPARLWEVLDEIASLGKPLQVTEFDVNTTDEAFQADYTRDFLTAVFAHPAVEAVLLWGFWEGRHWLPNAAMFRRDWSPKPNAEVWRDLIYRQWWTEADGASDEQGRFALRGFLGEYEVTVTAGESHQTVTVNVTRDGATIEMVMP